MDDPVRSLVTRLPALAGWRARRILDVRPAATFAAAHLPGAVSLPLPPDGTVTAESLAADLPSIFLPPRHVPLLVVAGNAALARAVADLLRERGRETVDAVVLPAGAGPLLPPELRERGPGVNSLWEPPRWLARHADLLPPPALGPALDLGCGSGRAAVWLAARGYRVTGIDHQPDALALAARLAAAEGVACRFLAADLRDVRAVPPGPWGLIVNIRFLHRPLLDRLGSLLVPGGVACVRTFREAPGYAGHPRPRHRLGPGQLLGAFPRAGHVVLAHQEDHDADGRPAAGIVVRRVGS